MLSVCCWGWVDNLLIHLWVDLIRWSFDSSSTEWERLTKGVPLWTQHTTKVEEFLPVANCDKHTLSHNHTRTDTNVENQWIYCTCLNRLALHYMDMKCENTHSIYLPTHNWAYITHTYTHTFIHTNTIPHTHTKHTIFTPAHTKYGLNISIHVYRHKWS